MKKFLIILVVLSLISYLGYSFWQSKQNQNHFGYLTVKSLTQGANIFVIELDKQCTGQCELKIVPGFYNIMVSKEGYQDWQNKVEVKENQRLEISDIRLIPYSSKMEALISGKIVNYLLLPNKNQIVYILQNNLKSFEVYVYNRLDKSNKSLLKLESEPIIEKASSDSSDLIFKLPKGAIFNNIKLKTDNWFVLGVNKSLTNNYIDINVKFKKILTTLKNSVIEQVIWQPSSNQRLAIKTEKEIYLLDMIENEVFPVAKDVGSYIFSDESFIYFLDISGLIKRYNPALNELITVSPLSLPFKEIKDLKLFNIISKNKMILIYQNESLAWVYADSKMQPLTTSISSAKTGTGSDVFLLFKSLEMERYPNKQVISKENIKDAWLTDKGQWVIFLNNKITYFDPRNDSYMDILEYKEENHPQFDADLNYLYFLDEEGLKRISL